MKTSVFKKILIAAVAAFMGISMSAQTLRYEVNAGVNISSYSVLGISQTGAGAHVGALAELSLPFVEGLYANAGLLASFEPSGNDEFAYKPLCLNLPIHAGYKYSITDKVSIFGEAGPYIGVKLVEFGTDEEGSVGKTMKFGAGFKLGTTILDRYKVYAGWDFNFLSATPVFKTKSNNVFIGIGYIF